VPTTEVSAHFAGSEDVPRIWPFNATEKLDPDVSQLLSMHCSWCVLYCGEAQDFHGEKRSNETHESKTDPDAKMARKGKEAKLSYNGLSPTRLAAAIGVEFILLLTIRKDRCEWFACCTESVEGA
jgi:hypothetical protein